MKHTYLPLLLTSLLATPALAQAPTGVPAGAPGATRSTPPSLVPVAPKGTGRLEGTVLDATTKKPVEYATVALLPATGETPVDGTVADDRGRFQLKGLAPGSYRLQITFIGYAAQTVAVTVTDGSTTVPAVALASSTQKLGEVTVTGERPVVESKPDRLVYNAAQDATNRGGTAADVLRKAPMLSVDPDGNLQLNGSANVRVLINGKPSAVVSGDLAQALKQLPADQIKNVEVITSPSAKYDGEGSGGIVNIVLKENNLQGINGNVGLAVGTRNSNGNLGLNARKGKLSLSSALNGWSFYAPGDQEVDRTDLNVRNKSGMLTTGFLRQRNDGFGMGGGGNGRIGLDYEPAPNHALSLALNGSLFRNRFDVDIDNTYRLAEGDQVAGTARLGNYERETMQKFRTQSYDLTGTYTRTFGQGNRREWTVLAQHSRNRNYRFYDVDQFSLVDANADGTPDFQEFSPNTARNLETTIQTDYVLPIKEKQTLEFGGKLIKRTVESDYRVSRAEADGIFAEESTLTNVYNYNQDVQAGYATYATPLGKSYNVRLGARVERTELQGNFQNQDKPFGLEFTNLLPNVALTRNLKQPGSTVRLSYSRRIQRPSIFYLNPYRNESDPRNISVGNQELRAEFTDNLELNWNTFVKSSVLNVTLYTRQTNNAIERINKTEDDGRVVATYGNVARNQTYGLNLFGSFKPLPKWDISGNVSTYYVYLFSQALTDLGQRGKNSGVVYSANINSGYKFDKGLSLQFFGMLNSPRIQLQGKSSAWQMYSIGLRKEILKGKGDFTLNADNPFTRYVKLVNDFNNGFSDSRNTTFIYNRGVRAAFSYRFGKLENKPQRPKRSIRNDDQKAGESGGQGQP
ncbi:TonB-dependent receptor [Hymenobacter lutimineralis]|uniref:TonB-dependent receptor n=1 Tax=Hymenobacter lutimineralis TaxID=2606448 RepID=A0A5D6VDF2_9BACT|nr:MULTISPECIES: TonB-dependent receptor [Hymenobacter]QIX61148.1 TonB-dependent receptor [Hymenobacter sp. BT18]TYZ13365.1 TonB-dependent receptor [Hymenobacter lutimineralis]